MEIIETENALIFRIEAQYSRINQIVCFTLGVITSLLGIGGLFIKTEFFGINLFFLIIMTIISFGYWDGFYWQKNGYEKLILNEDGKFIYLRKSLVNSFLRKGKVFNKDICIYDKKKHPSDSPPRSDGYVGAHGGRIIVWYYPIKENMQIDLSKMPRFFRFGKSLTSSDADFVIDKVKQFLI